MHMIMLVEALVSGSIMLSLTAIQLWINLHNHYRYWAIAMAMVSCRLRNRKWTEYGWVILKYYTIFPFYHSTNSKNPACVH
ncbi:hypothetical protein DFH27DRAFT_370608 [Peziza echinospora]|nr:hypothetical protein DFH27DRAFT_370608 [Peziza echinospora]